MTHPEIEAFLLAAKTGTITAAAEQLYVTQPALSRRIRSLAAALGYPLLVKCQTNQIFPILPKPMIEELLKSYEFYVWAPHSETHSVIRLVCSWATPEEKVDQFLEDFKALHEKYAALNVAP